MAALHDPRRTPLFAVRRCLLVCVALWLPCTSVAAELLHTMFQPHAVLQRDAPIRVYGRAQANAEVDVSLSGHRVATHADAEGSWEVWLPALPAGGPHRLLVRSGGASQQIDDVLIGDVWLCSGQSNMVLQVHRSLDARAEIAGASNDRIRMLTIGETGSVKPLVTFATPVQWRVASPATAADFSATCFYYARELQKTVDVPMGLVVAAWGGSRIQAWTSAEALRAGHGLAVELDALHSYAADAAAGAASWGDYWADWWKDHGNAAGSGEPWRRRYRERGAWRDVPASFGAWERWGDPALTAYDGMAWYRTTVRLDAAQAKQAAVLELGAADEIDLTWVNGRAIGSEYAPGTPRAYAVPAGLLRAGVNSVTLSVIDTYRDGGLAGPASAQALRFADGSRVQLDGRWRFRAEPESVSPPRAPWHTAAGLSTLYNGMIAPIGRYGFRGVLWYQGESNTFEAAQYGAMLRTLIGDWRARFGDALPWLNVQLAGYGPAPTQASDSGWAQLREVQRRFAEHDAHYGIATAVDIGDRYDIHPPNKQELGRRLARLARHLVYGEDTLTATGPVPVSLRRDGEAVVVLFGDVEEALVTYAADGPIGFELCAGIGAASCRYATATVHGREVWLRGAGVGAATRVRHAWADNPVITLFDRAGLPAQPFDLPIASVSEPSRIRP